MPSVAGASHVSLSVRDLDEAHAWFSTVFGTGVLMEEPGEERRAVVLTLPGTDLLVGLTEFRDRADDAFDPSRTGLDHFAFAVAREDELHEWARHLDHAGVEHSGVVAIPPGAILNLKGPDGIALAIIWRR